MNNLFSEEFNSYINDASNNGFTINYKGNIIRNSVNDMNPCSGEPVPYKVDLLKVRNNLIEYGVRPSDIGEPSAKKAIKNLSAKLYRANKNTWQRIFDPAFAL